MPFLFRHRMMKGIVVVSLTSILTLSFNTELIIFKTTVASASVVFY